MLGLYKVPNSTPYPSVGVVNGKSESCPSACRLGCPLPESQGISVLALQCCVTSGENALSPSLSFHCQHAFFVDGLYEMAACSIKGAISPSVSRKQKPVSLPTPVLTILSLWALEMSLESSGQGSRNLVHSKDSHGS